MFKTPEATRNHWVAVCRTTDRSARGQRTSQYLRECWKDHQGKDEMQISRVCSLACGVTLYESCCDRTPQFLQKQREIRLLVSPPSKKDKTPHPEACHCR